MISNTALKQLHYTAIRACISWSVAKLVHMKMRQVKPPPLTLANVNTSFDMAKCQIKLYDIIVMSSVHIRPDSIVKTPNGQSFVYRQQVIHHSWYCWGTLCCSESRYISVTLSNISTKLCTVCFGSECTILNINLFNQNRQDPIRAVWFQKKST